MMNLKLVGLSACLFPLLVSCTTTEPTSSAKTPSPPASDEAPKTRESSSVDELATDGVMDASRPKCLNIQDGDYRIEFKSTDLSLSTGASPKSLVIDDGLPVDCTKLDLVSGARTSAVVIYFTTSEVGTSVLSSDEMIAIASIKDAKWILKPTFLQRNFRSESGTESEVLKTLKWTTEKGLPVLTLTDAETKSLQTVRP